MRLTRDLALFLLGLGILGKALVVGGVPAELVTAGVALLLSPALTRVDDAKRDEQRREVGSGAADGSDDR